MARALSMNEIRARAARFALEWADSPGDERQDAQSFIRDFLAVYGITKTRAAFYEKRTRRTSTGARGYIDALLPGLTVIEMKSAGADLARAEAQALDYLDDLADAEMPRWVITSDFRRLRLLDLEGSEDRALEIELAELRDHADRFAWLAGYGTRAFGSKEQERASIEAAQLMAGLYEALEGSGYDEHESSVFLVRLLFALYGDDAGLWDRDLLLEFIETRTAEDGSDLGPQLSMLFQAMNKEPSLRQENLDELIRRFPYVNGGIFAGAISIPAFSRQMRERLLEAAKFNWSEISPAIFGSLFQAVKSAEARRALGEHYTTETNILKTLEPLFLDELRERFATNAGSELGLTRLRKDIADLRILDPAAGCGNFLVVAYRELRDLDLRIQVRLQELARERHDVQDTLFFEEQHVPVKLASFKGIELEEWPARIAATALHLAEHQANRRMELAIGMAPEALPLDRVDSITIGNALELEWSTIVEPSDSLMIVGNPPFLGHATRTPAQAEELRTVWDRNDIGRLDYVTGWYAKAMQLFSRPGYDGRFAFVSTNSITQGEPVPALFGPVFGSGWRIRFAHRTFAWTSEAPGAAAVHCTIVGFDRDPSGPAWLYDYAHDLRGEPRRLAVRTGINGYLVDGPNVLVEQRRKALSPDLPPMVFGNMPRDGGHLIVESTERGVVEADPVAAKYLRPYIGARELIHAENRWCLWLVDLDPADIGKSPVLRQRLAAVRAFREDSRAASTRQMAETPHLFGQRAHRDVPHLVAPRVSSETRRFLPTAWYGPEVIPSDATFTAEDVDGLAFGVISSSALITWQKTVGGRLESRLRFSNTLVWNTFPLPELSQGQRKAIIAGGKAVLEARGAHPDRSLADHYNPLAMTPELLRAHAMLDRAVDSVLGLGGPVDEFDRQKALFDNYQKLTEMEQLALPPRGRGRKRR